MLVVKMADNASSLSFRASKDGYKDRETSLEAAGLDARYDVELNIVMEPDTEAAFAVVSGTVRGAEGTPLAGQRVYLSSTRTRRSRRASFRSTCRL